MNRDFIEQQKTASLRQLEKLDESQESHKKKNVLIISQYLLSIIEPERFNEAQQEDLRKLALELGYKEDTDFVEWYKVQEASL